MGEEAVRIARGAEIEPLDRLDTGFAQNALRGRPEVQAASRDHLPSEACAVRVGDVVADLVAARPDSGPDRRREATAEHADARFDDSVQQAEAPSVEEREPGPAVFSRQRDRKQSAVNFNIGRSGWSVQMP